MGGNQKERCYAHILPVDIIRIYTAQSKSRAQEIGELCDTLHDTVSAKRHFAFCSGREEHQLLPPEPSLSTFQRRFGFDESVSLKRERHSK